jgi:hypothetical protein
MCLLLFDFLSLLEAVFCETPSKGGIPDKSISHTVLTLAVALFSADGLNVSNLLPATGPSVILFVPQIVVDLHLQIGEFSYLPQDLLQL